MKKRSTFGLILDFILVICTGGLWLIWILIRLKKTVNFERNQCTECGHKNSISSSNICKSVDDYENQKQEDNENKKTGNHYTLRGSAHNSIYWV